MAVKSKSAKARKERAKISAKKTAEENNKGSSSSHLKLPSGVKQWRIKKAGKYRLDIMPFIAGKSNPGADEGSPYFTRRYFAHRGVGANNEMVVCPSKTFGTKCPICEHRAKLMKDPDADEDVIRDLSPKKRNLFLMRDVGPKSDDPSESMVWDISDFLFPKQLFEKIDAAEEGDEEEADYQYFADPEDGSTLKIIAVEETFAGNAFYKVSDIEFTPRKEGYDSDIATEAPCLDEMLVEIPYSKLKAMFLETSDDDEDEDDDDEDEPKAKSKKKAPAKGKKAKPKDDDEDDDDSDDEDDSDDDEDEDEAPKKSKSKAKPAGKSKTAKLAIGVFVKHKKLGDCEVVHVSENGSILRLEDEDGEVHRGIKSSDCTAAEPDEDDEDEDEEPPKKSKAKPKSKAKAKPADDDDEDEDDEDSDDDSDDEDDEDEPPPKKGKAKAKAKPKSKAKAKKKPADDEDEDEDWDDEDEDDDDD